MSSELYQPMVGMSDLASPEIYLWQWLESKARAVFERYAFEEVRTPILERTAVFDRSLGDTTDVVQKEMYRFTDRGGRDVAMRPEGTAGVMRFIAGQGNEALESRVWYIGPMFRGERPAAGRRRQFHQVGAEALGPPSPAVDAEIIALQWHILQEWGVEGCRIELNTRGLPEDRQRVVEALRERLAGQRASLCEDCQRRYDSNPLRILDCKQETCRKIMAALPPVTSYMTEEARVYLSDVESYLKRLEIPYEINPMLVRGLDYYVHTVWEITRAGLGAQDALAGGGRYQVTLGSRALEGVGFALGIERVVAALISQGIDPKALALRPRAWLVSQGEEAFVDNMVLMQTLRERGVACGMDMQGRSMKAQMRKANKAGARFVVVRGEREMESGLFGLKDMDEGTQEDVDMPTLMERLCQPVQNA